MGLRRVRGVRSTLPTNTIIGRRSGGSGKAEMIDLADVARDLQTFGAGAVAGAPIGLPAIGDGHILANLSGSSAVPLDKSLTQLLDYVMGSTRGMILRRGASGWEALALGTNGQLLKSNGTDAAWATVTTTGSIATDTDVTFASLADKDLLFYQTSDSKWHNFTFSAVLDSVFGTTQGAVLYRGSSAWAEIAPSVVNTALTSGGPGANPSYVLQGGFSFKRAVAAATAVALPACTYANGTAGVGATLTENANGALTIDGISVTTGQRVLVKNQADAKQNGIYIVTATGSAGAVFVLTRTFDFDGSTLMDFGDSVAVGVGTANASSIYTMQYAPSGAIVMGTTTFTWVLVASQNILTTGTTTLAGQTDASISSPANLDILQYRTSAGSKWTNRTPTQITADLDAATATLKGLVPTPPNNTTTFLRGDATFAAPSGGGGGIGGLFSGQMSTPVPTSAGTGLSSWINQGTATVSDDPNGIYIDTVATTDQLRARSMTAPGTPYTIKAYLFLGETGNVSGHTPGLGIGFSDGTQFHILRWQYPGTSSGLDFIVDKWTSGSAFSGNDFTSTGAGGAGYGGNDAGPGWWVGIRDDGTNVKFYRSKDGVHFSQAFTVAKASGFLGASGYTKVVVYARAGGMAVNFVVMSWAVESAAPL